MNESHGDIVRASRAADEWRFNLARQLHQNTQQQLVNIVMYLKRADQVWTERPDESRQLLQLAAGEAQRTLDELRELVAEVYPPILATRGLAPALRSLAIRVLFPLDIDVQLNASPPALEPTLYFLCVQAVTELPGQDNVIAARITIVANSSVVTIEVHFEGHGVARGNVNSWLAPLHDRLLPYKGYLELRTSSDRSAVLTMHIPEP